MVAENFSQWVRQLVETSRSGGFPSRAPKNAVDGEGPTHHCMYRSPEGRKCAVGILISDENYRPLLEVQNCFRPDVVAALPGWAQKNTPVLCVAQHAHDALSSM